MAITQETFNGDGSNLGPFSFTFKWLRASDIKVSVNNVLKTAGTHYNLQALNYTTKTGGQVLFTAGNAPPVGTANIRVYRETDDTSLVATFSSGSSIRAADLNSNFTQELYKVQEVTNYSVQDVGNVTLTANYTFTYSPSAPTPTQNSHLATKAYVDGVAFAAGNLSTGNKGDITVNSAISWDINNSSVTTAKLATSSVTTDKIASGAVDGTKVSGVVAKTDTAQTFSAAQRGGLVALTDVSGVVTADLASGNNFSLTMNGNYTLGNPTNVVAGQSGAIVVTQGATVRTISFGNYWKFPAGVTPSLTAVSGAVDVFAYYVVSPTSIMVVSSQDVK